MEIEIWKDVVGYEGAYQVSDFGRVRGNDRMVWCKWQKFMPLRGRILSTTINKHGYEQVMLAKDGKRKRFSVHRIVLFAFVGEPSSDQVCCHRDSVRTNNCLSNLRWDTQRGNMADAIANGTSNRGERNHFAKLTRDEVVRIKQLIAKNHDRAAIAQTFKVSRTAIRDIERKRRWWHVDIPRAA